MRNVIFFILLFTVPTLASEAAETTAVSAQLQSTAQLSDKVVPLEKPFIPSEERIRVLLGKSIVITSPQPLKRVSVTDPAIASAVVVSPGQIMIHGLKAGKVTLLLWDEQERVRSFDLNVQFDLKSLTGSLKQVYPKENIEVSQSGSSVVLSGEVTSQAVAEKMISLSQTHAPSVVNMLQVRTHARDTVMLQVRFAEVDRAAVQQLGLNLFSTGGANTIGSTTTQQFGSVLGNIGAVPAEVQRGTDPDSPNLVGGGIGRSLRHTPAVFGLSDLLNIFLFRPDLNVGLEIKALQQKNLLQMLAEPNLLAVNGQEASFLAGGEFPFPVVQGGTNFSSVTIQFKEFGVKLKFIANVEDDGRIRLKVAPEVSSLDFANALTISGFLVPAISTRRADTEVDLRSGQSFAIAGLMDNRTTEVASKIPWLSNVPILGNLFKSRAQNRNNTELMVLVTPTIVKPLEAGQESLPSFPAPFLNQQKFDGKSDSGAENNNGPKH